ncbi:cytochrome P450 [Sulfitobacter sp. D35]|uniref:cytochrome P450 n=1 Tax=Sulfitobacter sp. D35 TaxID=3083252 RepID=UPI00296E5746|nr:cytochrome P450 [Sulfitobacter sp. D35]MDW4496742.1 cytochrome P450 [Sulfitobacter sp. D35]
MNRFRQSPRDPGFVQNPYPLYARLRAQAPVQFWEDYGMMAVFDAATVQALLRDRRLGRAVPEALRKPVPDHLRDFYAVDHFSMLDMEPPSHTRLRGLVLRAFTSRRIKALAPEIEAVCADLLETFPDHPFDLMPAYCAEVPVRIIARLLGVPETATPDLLRWSNAMVAMYQARRGRAVEETANAAARDFTGFLRDHIAQRRKDPRDDLLSELIAAEEAGDRLSPEEMIGTCVLLLNAGHEATVHTLGNGVKALLENATPADAFADNAIAGTVEEILRHDPPLHIFTRYAYEDIEVGGHRLAKNEEVALVLGAAGRDPAAVTEPDRFDPFRPAKPHAAFGGGLHFCVGAPLARLEMQIALQALFARYPGLALTEAPEYGDLYHFHGLKRLMVQV